MKLLRGQHWLSIWGLLALALQLAWAGAHVHPHGDIPSPAMAGFSALADTADAASEIPDSTHGEHQHESWPDCSTCWTQALAAALLLPFVASVSPRLRVRDSTVGWHQGLPPASVAALGFQARAPPSIERAQGAFSHAVM